MPDLSPDADGDDSFVLGANSSVFPAKLQPGEYVMSMDTINRGGILQTRPGSASLIFEEDIPGKNLQGITLFVPSTGPASLVWMVDGNVYHSPYPFKEYQQFPNLQFSKYSKYATWAQCVQSTDYTDSGILVNLPKPKSVLIIQDGSTRAAYWDGGVASHINPTISGEEFTQPDRDGTVIGLWMKWSNNRLWVSRNDMVFASDIGNPLKFTEAQYLNEARAFFLPGPCNGMVETSDQQGIICFTPESGVFLQTSIQDRTKWLTTPDFQKTVLPSIGCVSPRSIVQQYGLIWWMTPKGVISLNDALRLNFNSRLDVQDHEMASSKLTMSQDISMVCGSFWENFLFHAVPVGDKYNTRLHILDQAPADENPINSWPSYWEGWRPVEFARGIIGSKERIFCLSRDYDGVNRIWELFLTDKTDNGIPITSYVQTKLHLFGHRDLKQFKYAEVETVGINGDVSFMIAAAGLRGGFQVVGTKEVTSKVGQIYHDTLYGVSNDIHGSSSQTRIIKTVDGSDPSDCNGECIESDKSGLIDVGFSLLIAWCGIAGISAYRIFALPYPKSYIGTCENHETDETRLLTTEGCGSTDEISEKKALTPYFAEATSSRLVDWQDEPIVHTSKAMSVISQEAANRKASQTARWFVLSAIGELV